MKTLLLNTEEAPNKWWASQDARQRNLNNKSHYPFALRRQVDAMMVALGEITTGKIYEAYGKKGVSIKIDGGWLKNPKTLAWLEEDWTELGFVKKVTPQGIIYRYNLA